MRKIIGGTFPLPKTSSSDTTFLANARSAFYILADILKPKTVWLPDYYCPSMLESFREVKHYKTNNLTPCPDSFHPGDLVLFIDYFGWPSCQETIRYAKDCGAWTVADLSQAIANTSICDFSVYSPRKFLPMPDGGILISNLKFTLEEIPLDWWYKSAKAMRYRSEHEEDNKTWYKFFLEAKQNTPVGYYAMSDYSKAILSRYELPKLSRHRTNFSFLLDQLTEFSFFHSLPDDVIPLGFPVIVSNRDSVQRKMFAHDIFAPVHWRINHPLSQYILTLPCDFRYDESDMERVVKVFKECM